MSAEGGRGSGSARLWALTLVLAVAAVLIGFTGLDDYMRLQAQVHGQPYRGVGFWERLYFTAQMFVLDPAPLDEPPITVSLLWALYLALLTTVLAVVQTVYAVFRTRLVAFRLRFASGHAVVVGAGREAFVLAQLLADEPGPARRWHRLVWWRRTWPTMTVLVGNATTADVARRHDVRVVPGDPMDTTTLVAAGVPGATRVFAFAEAGTANAAVALATKTLHAERRARRARRRWFGRRSRPLPRVAVYARADDAELVAAMRARRLGAEGRETDDGYTLDFVDIGQRAAVKLLDRYDGDLGRHAAVVGSDGFAAAVGTELRRRRRRIRAAGAVTAVDISRWKDVSLDAARVYVSATDPDEVMRTAMQLLFRGHRGVVLCMGRRSALAQALEERLFDDVEGRLEVFSVLDSVLDPRALQEDALIEQLARALHDYYYRAWGRGQRASHTPWETLPEAFRADNRAQAEHIGVKLSRIRADIVPAVPGLPRFAFGPEQDEHGDDELEQLAIMEHDRWMRAKKPGFCWGPDRTDTTHPDYLPWRRGPQEGTRAPGEPDQLSEKAKEIDRRLVRELPDVLAVEGLAIVRRPPGTTSSAPNHTGHS